MFFFGQGLLNATVVRAKQQHPAITPHTLCYRTLSLKDCEGLFVGWFDSLWFVHPLWLWDAMGLLRISALRGASHWSVGCSVFDLGFQGMFWAKDAWNHESIDQGMQSIVRFGVEITSQSLANFFQSNWSILLFATWVGAMSRSPSLIEEKVVGDELQILKPMRFKVSVPFLNKSSLK